MLATSCNLWIRRLSGTSLLKSFNSFKFCTKSFTSPLNKVMEAQNGSKKFKESTGLVIGTHDGIFHCDELLACYMLQQLPKYENASILRSRNIKILDTCDIVVDVGAIFDKEKNRFDHHQNTFNETLSSLRPELGDNWNIKLSSAGLVYTYFGEDVIRTLLKKHKSIEAAPDLLKKVYEKVYEQFIREIDAIDNGVPMFDGEPKYNISTNLSSRVGHFNPSWIEEKGFNTEEAFEKAKAYVGNEFLNKVIYYSCVWWPARSIVIEAIKTRLDVHDSGEIMELKTLCPWKEHLFELEKEHNIVGIPKYVIFCSKQDDWRAICVSVSPSSFVLRKALHKLWRGIRDEDLAKISGIADSNFCHANGFIGGAKTREGAIQMAIASLNSKEVE